MIKHLKEVFIIYREVISAFYVLRKKYNEKEPCKDATVSHEDARSLGIDRGGFVAGMLEYYKLTQNDTHT